MNVQSDILFEQCLEKVGSDLFVKFYEGKLSRLNSKIEKGELTINDYRIASNTKRIYEILIKYSPLFLIRKRKK